MTRSKTLFVCLGILIAAVILFNVISGFATKPDKKSEEAVLPIVNTINASPSPFQLTVHTQGRVQSRQTTTLATDVAGNVTWISDLFNEGKTLKKGFVIAKIDRTQYQSNLAQAKANLAQMELALAEEQARGQQAKEDWESLLATGENAQTETNPLVLRTPHLKQAEAQVEAAQAAVEKAKQDLAKTQIKMPFSGIIDSRELSIGQFLNMGAPVATLLGQQKEIRLPLTASQSTKITDSKAKVILRYGSLTEQATLSHLDGNIDPSTQVRYATVSLPIESQIPVGAYVDAAIEGQSFDATISLPLSALHKNASNVPVFYTLNKENNELIENEATQIQQRNEQWVLDVKSSSIPEGTPIVVTRLPLMKAGLKVNTLDNTSHD